MFEGELNNRTIEDIYEVHMCNQFRFGFYSFTLNEISIGKILFTRSLM